MAKLLQLRRGTTSQHSSFTGAVGEVTVDTEKDSLVVHDGSTQGGFPIQPVDAELTELATMTSGTAGALADLTQTEVEILDGATVTTAELNILDEVTADKDELNILDGVTSTTAELNTLDGFTGAYTDLNYIDVATAGTAEASKAVVLDANKDITGLNDITAVDLTLSGDLTVNGTTTTIDTTNTTVTDNLLELNSGAGSNANDCGIIIERGSTGDNAIIAWDESADKFTVGTTTDTASSTGNITITAGTLVVDTLEDSKGDVRSIPQNTQASTYVLAATDAGKHILASGTVTIPNNIFSTGDAVTIINNTGSDLTLTKSITTMYNTADDGDSADRTLATRGMATILFASETVAYISGAGLS